MPELGPKDKLFARKILEKPRNLDELKTSVENSGKKYIGSGSESVVVNYEDNPDKVLALNYNTLLYKPEEAKKIFYLHRVFSILFPHNFPHFYATSGEDLSFNKDNFSGSIREKIKETKISYIKKLIEVKLGIPVLRYPHKYPFMRVEEVCRKLGISVLIDKSKQNFITRDDGGEYFVDTLKSPNIEEWDMDKIKEYMKLKKYSERDMEIVERSVERLRALSEK